MRQNGITAFCDMYFFEDRVAAAAREAQMQVVVGEGIMDLPTPSAKNSNEGLLLTEKLLKKYQNDPYVKVAVAPHSIYTTTADTLKKAKNLAQKYNALFHLHLAETKKNLMIAIKKIAVRLLFLPKNWDCLIKIPCLLIVFG